MEKILGIDRKEILIRNKCLVDTSYYDQIMFYNVLTLTRSRNTQSCADYEIVLATASFSKVVGSSLNDASHTVELHLQWRTFSNRVRSYGDKTLDNIASESHKFKITIAALENNQKRLPRKYQRFGSLNNLAKDTSRYFRQFCLRNNNCNQITNHCFITYINQSVPSLDGVVPFEKIHSNNVESCAIMIDTILSHAARTGRIELQTDFSGKRVKSCIKHVDTCDEMQNGKR